MHDRARHHRAHDNNHLDLFVIGGPVISEAWNAVKFLQKLSIRKISGASYGRHRNMGAQAYTCRRRCP